MRFDAHGAPIDLEAHDVGISQLDNRAVGLEDVAGEYKRECELIDDDERVLYLDVGDNDSCVDVAHHVKW